MTNINNPNVADIAEIIPPILLSNINEIIADIMNIKPYIIHIIPLALLYAFISEISSVFTIVPDQKCIGVFFFNAYMPIQIKTIAHINKITANGIVASI